ncbi:MAG: fused MFS/spermidine synthase [Candidatus Omnitrophica bacterium]|nr:fused MFS/spermidine synthase [Candidatus Omnitrophota bacterium]
MKQDSSIRKSQCAAPAPQSFRWSTLLIPKQLPSKTMQRLILVCFFFSGACGLVYEVAWLRVLGLIFGNTTFATSTVLAGYMAGLGLGALWWGKRIDRGGDPVKTYAKLEAGIGVYALLTPLVWILIDLLTIGFYRFISPAFFTALLFKFLIAFTALIIPTFLMGATLPVLSKYFVTKDEEVAKQVGLLYGLNTLGAVLGVLFSGFFALQTFGVWQTVYLTGAFNLVIFYLCLRFFSIPDTSSKVTSKNALPKKTMEEQSPSTAFSPIVTWTLLAAFAISGAVSMMYEIAWTRVLAMALGSSVYAFSLMLATFLLGLSLGSYLFSKFSRAFRAGLQTFAILQLLTALFGLWGINLFNDMPYYFVKVFAASRGSDFLLHLGRFFLCSIVMLPPTLMIGAMFSCFIHILRSSRPLGSEIGEAYFANTIGTILGSVLTGFCIIPLVGIQHTLLMAAGLNAAIGATTFFLQRERFDWKRYSVLGLATLLLAFSAFTIRPWNQGFIASELAVKPAPAIGMTKNQLLNSMEEQELLFYKEGLSATVAVKRLRDDLSLSVNGKVDASNKDTFTQFLLGHLPMALHPDPKKVCVIGLGSGSTVAAVASYPVEKIDAIELEKEVVNAAGYFKPLNRNVLADPRLRIHINDGRNFLLLDPTQYDVIISEPSNPWMAGVANLFSIEHYRTMKKRLAPGGIVCQWLHAYSMSPDDLRMIIRTFSEVFPDISLWTSYYPDLMLIGTNEPISLDLKNFERAFKIPTVRKDLEPNGIQSPLGFFSNAWLFDPELRLLTQDARINSDNHPFLEFSAPRNLYKNTLLENFALLNTVRNFEEFPRIKGLEPPQEKNAAFYNALARGYLAKRFNANAEWALGKAGKIDPANLETELLNGIFYYQIGAKDKAKEILTQAVSIDPSSAEAQEYLGSVLQELGQMPQAIEAFQKASDLVPGNVAYLVTLGNALFKNEQSVRALQCFNKALATRPDDFDTWAKKAMLVMKIGTVEEKTRVANDILLRYPRFTGGYELLGNLLEQNGRSEEALGIYQKMAGLFPNESKPYLHLARASDRLGHRGDMKKYLKKAARLDPALADNPSVRKILHS